MSYRGVGIGKLHKTIKDFSKDWEELTDVAGLR